MGSYLYRYSLPSNKRNCQSCSSNIPGCETCASQGECKQCQKDLRLINGICYYQDGTIVNPGGSSVNNHWSTA
jgi:hypothetical protein